MIRLGEEFGGMERMKKREEEIMKLEWIGMFRLYCLCLMESFRYVKRRTEYFNNSSREFRSSFAHLNQIKLESVKSM